MEISESLFRAIGHLLKGLNKATFVGFYVPISPSDRISKLNIIELMEVLTLYFETKPKGEYCVILKEITVDHAIFHNEKGRFLSSLALNRLTHS